MTSWGPGTTGTAGVGATTTASAVRPRTLFSVFRRGTGGRVPWKHGRMPRWVVPVAFLIVPLALLITFTYLPVLNMFWYSLTEWDGLSTTKEFVGLDNYREIFTRPDLFRTFYVSLYYAVGAFVQMIIALFLATALSGRLRARNLFKGIFFFPYLINGVAIGFVFLYFFRPEGTLDATLALLGLENLTQQWLGDASIVNISLAATSVWRYTGLTFVLFLGAIQSIPGEIYEAAELDGANRWHQFRYIIAPSIRPIISLTTILAIAGAISVFEIPYIMTGGRNGSETFVIKTVNLAFVNNKVGLASAMAVVLFAIVLIVTWIQRRLVPEEK